MSATKNDLWGNFKGLDSSRTPYRILREQSDLLTEKTYQRLNGQIGSKISSSGLQRIDFKIYAPALDNLILDFLTIEYDLDLYPVEIRHDGHSHFCDSEASYKSTLEDIFSSEETRRTITSLLVQIRYTTPQVLDSIDGLLRAQSAPAQHSLEPPIPEQAPIQKEAPPEPEPEPEPEDTKEEEEAQDNEKPSGPFADLQPGQKLEIKEKITKASATKLDKISSSTFERIFIRNISAEGLSITLKNKRDEQFDALIPPTAKGKKTFQAFFQTDGAITDGWKSDSVFEKIFPDDFL